ncbi:RNA polymerase sigma factor [Olivibacter domesticus]|uniref:RNA polymerase sigma-70 factor, ECF subfamily n=1 Tax=Olivibacter domesticus TaxID=407022 RepID=A0A1H7Z655_OLID1|nr:sigma-70 family RNA polymerase sigma factor [Olivibacter domesticus]SEM53028.1 RNA polymerase sigma-70 factor, ECF subfamily [Olivibacter domesticus]
MTLQKKTDRQLVHLYLAGNEGAIEELVHRYKSKIYTSIYLLVKDSYLAEDLFQDTFIKVIKTLKAGRYNDEGKFLPWAMRIAHNLVIDYYRKEKRTPLIANGDGFDIFDVLPFYDESMEERIIRHQSYKDLRKMIQLLPDDQKEVLIMRHYGEMSFKEIAEVTDVSINTALGRMRYALNNLRKMITSAEVALKTG